MALLLRVVAVAVAVALLHMTIQKLHPMRLALAAVVAQEQTTAREGQEALRPQPHNQTIHFPETPAPPGHLLAVAVGALLEPLAVMFP
jgi:hypothetical protein